MSKLTDYSAVTRFDSSDILIKDGTNGTKKIAVEDAAVELAGLVSSVQHRNVYRGKYLGNTITDEQKAAIKAGTFDDLFIGDYWTINSRNWRIADMDYWYNIGDTNFTTHHLVIVPDTSLGSAQMNSSNTTEGGYLGSEMYTTNMETMRDIVTAAWGDMVLTHRRYLCNAVSSGSPSGYAWTDANIELMSEIMVYGTKIRTTAGLYTADKTQLALFQLYPRWINIRTTYWLMDVYSSTAFANVSGNGAASFTNASNSYAVRPAFPVGVS